MNEIIQTGNLEKMVLISMSFISYINDNIKKINY